MRHSSGHREAQPAGLISLALALGTLACYWPARHFDFVNLDDPTYVYSTPMVTRGLSWPGLAWAFRSFDGGNWNPLVWLSHMADCQLYGLNPGGHHLTNLALHILNVLLLFLVFRSMTGAIWRSAFLAAMFAWHPMHVESVAWVAERKDVLSTSFWLGAIWAYAAFTKATGRPRPLYYGLALLLFALGLMCKSMLVTLPLVFFLLDYWPLRRAEPPGKLVLEKIPFLALSLAASVLAVGAQQSVGALGGAPPLAMRMENAVVAYAVYIEKLFWPVDLAVFYPFPQSIPIWQPLAAALLLAAASWAVIWGTRQRRYLGVGWFWFLGTLVPVIGVGQVGMQSLADRYTYVPYIGLALIVSWGLGDLAEAWPRARTAVALAAALALACCVAATSRQVGYWRNNTSLYQHALRVTSGNYLVHNNLGNMLTDDRKLAEAANEYQEVIRLKPTAAKPYNNLGKVYALQDKLSEAMPLFARAISLDPKMEEAHYNLGHADLQMSNTTEAVAELRTALRLNPDDGPAQQDLADALIKSGKAAEAIAYFENAAKRDRTDAHAYFSLGWACEEAQQPEQALASYKEASRLAPDNPQCLNAVAWILATCPKDGVRNGPEAVTLATRACAITKRRNTALLDTLATALAEAGRFDEAIKTTEEFQALAVSAHDTNTADMARKRLELYKARKPYRDAP
jgi:protein O-mannosyl-transferase